MCIPPSVRTPPSALTLAQLSQTRIDYIVHSPLLWTDIKFRALQTRVAALCGLHKRCVLQAPPDNLHMQPTRPAGARG